MTGTPTASGEPTVNIQLLDYGFNIPAKELVQQGSECAALTKSALITGLRLSPDLRTEYAIMDVDRMTVVIRDIVCNALKWMGSFHGIINVVVSPKPDSTGSVINTVCVADKKESKDSRLMNSSYISFNLAISMVKNGAVDGGVRASVVISLFNPQ
jgi:hypothetical protein